VSGMTSAKTQALVRAISNAESREKNLGQPVSSTPGKLEDLGFKVGRERSVRLAREAFGDVSAPLCTFALADSALEPLLWQTRNSSSTSMGLKRV
jgi:hypothetical protein